MDRAGGRLGIGPVNGQFVVAGPSVGDYLGGIDLPWLAQLAIDAFFMSIITPYRNANRSALVVSFVDIQRRWKIRHGTRWTTSRKSRAVSLLQRSRLRTASMFIKSRTTRTRGAQAQAVTTPVEV